MPMVDYMELSELQELIRGRIGSLERWVRVEIGSHSESGGHHYFDLIEKTAGGEIAAKARGTVWRFRSSIITAFARQTGRTLSAGMTVVMKVEVVYHPQFGLSLNITDIDPNYSIGQRELEKRRTMQTLASEGLMERQKSLELPVLPSRIAVISSSTAAGYGDFMNQLAANDRGYAFDCTLFQSLMQGENAPASIIESLHAINEDGSFDVVLIFRGGGAEADMYCFDDCDLCRNIASSGIPVLTAIGHERDYHIADMVAHDHFKTPTALAVFMIDWVSAVEDAVTDILDSIVRGAQDKVNAEQTRIAALLSDIKYGMAGRVSAIDAETRRCLSNICFALNAGIKDMDAGIALLAAGIESADPRAILRQGYVLASDSTGTIIRTASSKSAGDDFVLRFMDGRWSCRVNDVELKEKK